MRLLLDSHIAIWAVIDSPRLSATARDLIGDHDNDKFVSAVTILEIAIKRARRPEAIPIDAKTAIGLFAASGYEMLPVSADHAAAVERLPSIHHDPFDRLLAAQALQEPLRLITRDLRLARYSDTFILA